MSMGRMNRVRNVDAHDYSITVEAGCVLADVQRAMELPDDTSLGGELLSVRYGLTWESEEIYMPEMGANVVGVRVIYAMPHIRKLGDPEIA